MPQPIRIGTRDSRLAVWQATQVSELLQQHGYDTELVYIKSEGDLNLVTPLYEIGVQGIFTKTLDIALLNKQIDIAVHSMKDVPVVLPKGIVQAAVLPRGNHKDLLVWKDGKETDEAALQNAAMPLVIATSSVRRQAQWLHRYPHTRMENLRGNVQTRLKKLAESEWTGAIFAAAGLERVGLRPANALELDWMLPAPAQGAIMVVCRSEEEEIQKAGALFHDAMTALCVQEERAFLKTLMGGCTAPISALAVIEKDNMLFSGSLLSVDGSKKLTVAKEINIQASPGTGIIAATEILNNGGDKLMEEIRSSGK